MGREQVRKEAKKLNREFRNINNNEESNEVTKLLKILILITIILVVLYFVVGIFITKDIRVPFIKDSLQKVSVEMNADYILASETFKQKEEKYYVYFYKFNEENTTIKSKLSSVGTTRVYKVDMTSAFNAKYKSETEVKSNNIDEFKFKEETLILIENGNITSMVTGIDNIINSLN